MSIFDNKDSSTKNGKNEQAAQSHADSLAVLVIDDDVLAQRLMSVLLTQSGHVVEPILSGADAINLLKSRKFDLIFLDIHMPFMDGFETCQQIRMLEGEGRHTPIVALTAYDAADEGEKCLAAGMDDYVFKPLGQSQLARVLASCVDGKYRPATPEPPAAAQAETEKPILDVKGALPYVGNDMETYKELLAEFVGTLPEKSVQLGQYLGSGKWQEILSEVHGLKGRAAALGAVRLASFVLEMEQQVRGGQTNLAEETFQKIKICVQLLQSNAYEFLNDSKE